MRDYYVKCGFLAISTCLSGILSFHAEARVEMAQKVSLVQGWNAVYLRVGPTDRADAFFADWPVDWVAGYDPVAFQETRQYSGTDSSEGTVRTAYKVWRRGDPGASSLVGVPGNAIYTCFATNAWTKTVYGVPLAPRLSWHPCGTNAALNLVGLSVATGKTATVANYFSGLDSGASAYFRFCGTNVVAPTMGMVWSGERFVQGEVLAVDATKVSDWSGVLYVSPVTGVDFSTNVSMAAVSVRNDGATARTVCVALSAALLPVLEDTPTVPQGLMLKDVSTQLDSQTNVWTSFIPDTPFSKRLAAGETLTLNLALNRMNLPGAAGTRYGALLSFQDVDGGSEMEVTIPIEATSDGGAAAARVWPNGIWLASAELDTVTHFGETREVSNDVFSVSNVIDEVTGETTVVTNFDYELSMVTETSDIPSGGKMPVRLPMYVARDGSMSLLQRFRYGFDADGGLHVYSGAVTNPPVKLTGGRRISSSVLPVDTPVIASEAGAFGANATFRFTVASDARSNPMRHPYHPQHDGLAGVAFEKSAPSGDDLANYAGTVKPELFTITNVVEFVWDDASKGAAWNPEETLGGMLKWEFGGLRHEETIRATGRFTMRRITSAPVEK